MTDLPETPPTAPIPGGRNTTSTAGGSSARTLVWAASCLVLVLIAAQVAGRTLDFIGPVVAGFPGWDGVLFIVAYGLGGVALIVWTGARGSDSLRGHMMPAAAIAVAVVVRVALALVADAPLTGENRIVQEQALGVLDGACCHDPRPLGYPIALAAAFRTLGIGPHAVEILNLIFAALTTWLAWDIGRIAWSRRVGAMAAVGYAVMPSAVLMTLVPLTEPLYTLMICAAVRFTIGPGHRWIGPAVATATVIALAQYVRPTAAAILLPVIVLPLLSGFGVLRTSIRAAVIVVVFLVLLVPVLTYNLEANDDLSISTSAYGGWSMYVGANREYGGKWNREDADRFSAFPGTTAWEKSKHAGSLAWDRYSDDPRATLELFVRKFKILVGDEQYAAAYALPTTAAGEPTRAMWVGWVTSQLFWLALTAAAAAGMVFERRDPRPAALLIGMIVVVVVASHALLEAHGRYHAYLVPLLWVLGAAGLDALLGRGSRVRMREMP